MKTIKTLIYITFITLLTSACSFSPNSFYGAHGKNMTFDPDKVERSDAFKLMFIDMMPKSERGYLIRDITNTLEKNARYNDLRQEDGQNGMAIAALGGNPLDGGVGTGISLALGAVSYISNANSAKELTFGMYLKSDNPYSDSELEDLKIDIRKRAVDALVNSASNHGYSAKCLYNCGEVFQTFELTRMSQEEDETVFMPKKLIGHVMLVHIQKVASDSIAAKVFGEDTRYYANLAIEINDPYNFNDDGSVKYYESKKGFKGYQESYHFGLSSENIIGTPIGRKLYRDIGKALPNWIIGIEVISQEFGLYQGEVYSLENLSRFNEFHGKLITN